MIAHNVFFTLEDSSSEAVAELVADCKTYLADHDGTVFFAVGALAAGYERPVNDLEFDVALHSVFESRAAHDAYQVAPRHLEFIERRKANWKSVRVFDSEVSGVA